jgi:tRNA (cytidine/uridine-2'-O-)-methyltransferase
VTLQPSPSSDLREHRLKIALLHPQIAPNTGNIARACVATGAELHLIRPLGFVLSDRQLRRSAMDYWPRLKLTVHDDAESFFATVNASQANPWLFTSKASTPLWSAHFAPTDWLIFGSETAGIPEPIRHAHPGRLLRIPQVSGERCLNLSTAAAIGLYEAIRQIEAGRIPE